MRIDELIAEAARTTWAQKVSSLIVALLAGAMCVTTLLTVGRTAAAEGQVAQRLEDAGSRHLVVADASATGFLSMSTVDVIASLNTVERVIGVSTTGDVTSALAGTGALKVPVRTVVGDLASAVDLVAGRWPAPGEALASATALDRLAFDAPVGAVRDATGATVPVVGRFTARAPYSDLAEGLVLAGASDTVPTSLDIVVTSSSAGAATETAVLRILDRPDPRDVRITSPATLAEVQGVVMGDLGIYSRRLMVLVLTAGACLVAAIALADVMLHRKDLGRRRALGASRAVLIGLTVVRSVIAAIAGAGVGAGTATLALRASTLPLEVSFLTGTAVLAVLITAAATVPPAVLAAFRDPVEVLRTP